MRVNSRSTYLMVVQTVAYSTTALNLFKETTMKCEVQLFVAGQVFTETVHAVDYQEARQVALARNPNARIISVNKKF